MLTTSPTEMCSVKYWSHLRKKHYLSRSENFPLLGAKFLFLTYQIALRKGSYCNKQFYHSKQTYRYLVITLEKWCSLVSLTVISPRIETCAGNTGTTPPPHPRGNKFSLIGQEIQLRSSMSLCRGLTCTPESRYQNWHSVTFLEPLTAFKLRMKPTLDLHPGFWSVDCSCQQWHAFWACFQPTSCSLYIYNSKTGSNLLKSSKLWPMFNDHTFPRFSCPPTHKIW